MRAVASNPMAARANFLTGSLFGHITTMSVTASLGLIIVPFLPPLVLGQPPGQQAVRTRGAPDDRDPRLRQMRLFRILNHRR